MRITNGILQKEALRSLQESQQGIADARDRASTGIRVSRASDDPVATTGILQASGSLRALDQYRRNLSSAQARLGVEESILEQVTNILTRAKELAASQGTATANAATRATTRVEVDEMLNFTRDLGNQKYLGSYLFGGDFADRKPFTTTTPDPLHLPAGQHRVEVGAGQVVDTNHSGQRIFIDSGVFTALEDLSDGLLANDQIQILAALDTLDTAFQDIQNVTGEVGARLTRVEIAGNNVDTLDINLQTLLSGLRDADLAKAVTELVARQSTFQAALLANATILSTSLTDFLR